ncbi:chloroplast sensor kinase, chloroplastic [Quillaja saponaria]|uniref:Chloroplast sensor kinase, chloroplastic n=1 Tax=Quillaja saponaria TaxID=32244 RepID=A0AAD7PIF0_QUISA|nr:chloroplast sensor kinase, chloroplastic [Quillaja saponaria]
MLIKREILESVNQNGVCLGFSFCLSLDSVTDRPLSLSRSLLRMLAHLYYNLRPAENYFPFIHSEPIIAPMLVSAITAPQLTPCNTKSQNCNFPFCPDSPKVFLYACKPDLFTQNQRRPLFSSNASSPPSLANTSSVQNLNPKPDPFCSGDGYQKALSPSASALASAIRGASTSPVEFIQRIEKDQKSGLVLPSPDFQRLCFEQLDLFRRIVDPSAVLSVYVRPAGSYVMDRLELRRVALHPRVSAGDILVLVGHFSIPAGLRAAEAALSNLQLQVIPENKALVLPMVKHPFVVGFLVAELPIVELETCDTQSERHDIVHCPSVEEAYASPPVLGNKSLKIQITQDVRARIYKFTAEQRSNAINISRSLAMAYVMDQKAMLLQQSSWQNNVRMSNLVEQIHGPLSSIRTLSKMLSTHMKRSEISYDIVEDIVVQGDRLRDTLQQLQDAVYVTKANIVQCNEEAMKKMHGSAYSDAESVSSKLSNNFSRDSSVNKMHNFSEPLSLSAAAKDLEIPLPPLALAPLQHGIRPCNVSEVLGDLVDAVRPLAHKQQRVVQLSELSSPLLVAVEEPALRQALSNLIEGALLRTQVGGKVEIVSTDAPAGATLIIIDDDGPDMHYMTQMHSLTPYGVELFSEDMVEDNMTWNFVAGMTVAREILESYGCSVRVISPRTTDAALGAGGTRVELWLPSSVAISDINGLKQEV